MQQEDLPKSDSSILNYYLIKILNLLTLKKYGVQSFPVIVSVAKESPAYEEKLLENDIILAINKESTSNFRKKLKKALLSSSKINFTLLRKMK